jgi:superfamily I DNA/RNA helicase
VINNRNDDLRLQRIVNNPPRGLGAKTIETVQRLAQAEGKGLYHVIADPYNYGPLEKSAGKLMQFACMIEELAQLLDTDITLPEFYDEVLNRTGYVTMLESKPTEEVKETEAPREATKTVTLELPADRTEDYNLGLFLNGRAVLENTLISVGTQSIDVTLTGSGTVYYDLYINDAYYKTVKVVFS